MIIAANIITIIIIIITIIDILFFNIYLYLVLYIINFIFSSCSFTIVHDNRKPCCMTVDCIV